MHGLLMRFSDKDERHRGAYKTVENSVAAFDKNGRQIGVVFEIRRKPSMLLGADPVLNRTKTIYYSYEDIAPEEIVNVLVWGEYGLENIKDIFAKAKQGNLQPHQHWTGQFGRMLF